MRFLLYLLMALALAGSPERDPDIRTPEGCIGSQVWYSSGHFMDWMDYGILEYPKNSRSIFERDADYHPVTKEDLTALRAIVRHFRRDAGAYDDLRDACDLSSKCMDAQDFFSLIDERPRIEHYTLWYFDSQSDTLYYMDNKW